VDLEGIPEPMRGHLDSAWRNDSTLALCEATLILQRENITIVKAIHKLIDITKKQAESIRLLTTLCENQQEAIEHATTLLTRRK
jgi:membrane carboxypeptidase/penicillin-binding protein PbpC